MNQQEFLESPQHYERMSVYEEQGAIEPIREYAGREQNHEFVNRHLHGEKVQPQPGTKSAAWSMIPLLVLLFVIGGGAFGLTAAFHSTYMAAPHWNDDDFVPRHEWHHPHHFRCSTNDDSDQQMVPGGHGEQDGPVNPGICARPDD